MHIIVDIRTQTPADNIAPYVGKAWADLWKRHKPTDQISFLIYEHQHIDVDIDCIVASYPWGPFGKKKLIAKKSNQVFRVLSFSHMSPYDPSIPTLSHIWTNAPVLYPTSLESSLMSRFHMWNYKRWIQKNTHIIVPHIQIWHELVELYNIGEDRIDIIPAIPLPQYTETAPMQQIHTPNPYYIYDGSYGHEADIIWLLAAWERYRHDGGTHDLYLLWSAGESLSDLTQTIRSFDIHTSVKYLSVLDEWSAHILYRNAGWWIYTGSYYGGGPMIERARAYGLPMLLSDIPVLSAYDGIKIHPNHKHDIIRGLHSLESTSRTSPYTRDTGEKMYIHAYEKILATNSIDK